MHFKRLELFGFKSFAERTVFHFEPGVTAIVGPNGCGKTNGVDAIRWVLGEQNARDLRGNTMEDVIFNGTDALPALGFAEVSLTLSNDDRALPIDYAEVTVTRRVYRSGESEYLLNKLPVRLKDIQELFMGTGIGTESYSIIGQGKMNQVLSSKPDDRRLVFEEASGITKYKTKKREALRRLEETEQNLLRVNDIVTEVQRQLRSIERQAEKARKYQERFDQLREAELTAAAIERAQLLVERATQAQQQQALEDRARTATSTWEALRNQLEQLTQQRETLMQQLGQQTATRAELRGTLERHAREIQLKTQWRQDLEQQGATLEAECAVLRAQLQQLAEQLATTQRSLDEVTTQEAEHAGRVQGMETRVAEIERAIRDAQHAMATAKQTLLDRTAALAKVKSELAKLGATAQAHQARIRRLRADHAQLQTQTATLDEQRATLRTRLTELDTSLTDETQALAALQTQRTQAERAAQSTLEAVTQLQQSRATQLAECALLEQLWRRHEGFSAGVKALLDAQRPEVVGVLADALEVHAGYEPALEAAFGDILQSVIVSDTASAFQLLRWLREGRHGRAHLLPLDHVVGAAHSSTSPLDLAGARPALELVTIRDARIAPFVQHQLSNVWVVDDLTQLPRWPAAASVRLVDRQGHAWINGCLAGGQQTDNTSVIGRRARLDGSRAQLSAVEQQLTTQAAALQSARASLTTMIADVTQRTTAVQDLKQEHATYDIRLKQLEETAARVQEEREVVAAELSEAEREFADVERAQSDAATQATDAEIAAHTLEHELNEQQATVAAHAQQRETQLVELAGLKAGRDAVTERRVALETMRADLTARQRAAAQALEQKQTQMAEARARDEQFAREVTEHQQASAQVSVDETRVGDAITAVTQQADALKQQLTALEPNLTREQDALTQIREEQRANDKALAELTFREQSLSERIRDHYKCEIPPHELAPGDAAQLATLRATIEREREKLDAIGPVSLGSISEQEELTQRHTFLTTQQQDLLQAQGALKEAIQKMNRETRKLFLETFERIQQEFQYFFKLLFGGGKAELALMDQDNVLDCGIEITAQPPGKKLQSITLLSGGEQAMTAIALLFALFKVRPSPFCILDEIDAPLDEANVDRFTKGLNEFTKLSQFIIVTHNKKTLTRAEVMYGITMEQAGVSKIVSVKFAEPTTPPQPTAVTTAVSA